MNGLLAFNKMKISKSTKSVNAVSFEAALTKVATGKHTIMLPVTLSGRDWVNVRLGATLNHQTMGEAVSAIIHGSEGLMKLTDAVSNA